MVFTELSDEDERGEYTVCESQKDFPEIHIHYGGVCIAARQPMCFKSSCSGRPNP